MNVYEWERVQGVGVVKAVEVWRDFLGEGLQVLHKFRYVCICIALGALTAILSSCVRLTGALTAILSSCVRLTGALTAILSSCVRLTGALTHGVI